MGLRLALRNPFASLFTTPKREHHLARYVIREHARGRTLEEVLNDPYIRNRSTPEERNRLLERPEVIEAIGEKRAEAMRRNMGSTQRPPAGRGVESS